MDHKKIFWKARCTPKILSVALPYSSRDNVLFAHWLFAKLLEWKWAYFSMAYFFLSLSEWFNCFIWLKKISLQNKYLYLRLIYIEKTIFYSVYFILKSAQSLSLKHNSKIFFFYVSRKGKYLTFSKRKSHTPVGISFIIFFHLKLQRLLFKKYPLCMERLYVWR